MIATMKPLLNLCAADIMSDQVVMIPRHMSLQGAARMLARANVTGAPVVDEAGRCIGVLSATDFMYWVKEEHAAQPVHPAKEAMCLPWQIPDGAQHNGCVESSMTKDPVLVTASVKIGELARMMMDAHIHRIIVVDRISERPIGIVSSMDILSALARADAQHTDEGRSPFAPGGDTVHD